jgi:hypothetical protein
MNKTCRYGLIGLLLFVFILIAQIRGGQGDLIQTVFASAIGAAVTVGIIKFFAGIVSLGLSKWAHEPEPDPDPHHPI